MSRVLYSLALLVGIPLLTALYTFMDLGMNVDKVFLTVSTFIFSIFTGFFISRQASRFNKVRETVTAFDGQMSAMYRSSGLINAELQNTIGKIVTSHYQKILETQEWNIHFLDKSNTLTSLNKALEEHVVEDDVTKLSNQALGSIVKSLAICQLLRKQMVALHEERIPKEQWVLIFFFAAILVSTVSVLPSAGFIFGSLLKAAFVASVLSVVFILYKLNNLIFSEKLMGEHSAHDVLEIIGNKK